VNDERPLEDELLELIGHRFRRNLIHIADLANLELASSPAERSDSTASMVRIKAEALQALSVIDAVLSLAQQDKTPVLCAPFDLAVLVRQLTPGLQQLAIDAGATLMVDAPVSPLEVLGSVKHLQNMLPLLLEFALWQSKPDCLHLQIVPNATVIRLSLKSDVPTVTPNTTSSEPMPLANLLSLWAYVRGLDSCGGASCYVPVVSNDTWLLVNFPCSNSPLQIHETM